VRWLVLVLALVAAAVLAVAVAGFVSRNDADDLLPDLDQAVPSAVAIRREGDRELLVFASAVDNVGAGPLVVRASRSGTDVAMMSAHQVIRRADGSEARRPIASLLRYERAETHAHWHLDAFERYELRDASGDATLLVARKAGFCLGDRYDSRRSVDLPGEPSGAVWTHECGKGQPDLLSLEEGISVGYGDDYAPRLEGQFVDVSDVPPGRYLLVHVANPRRALRESRYANNAASVALVLRRPAGRAAIEVVARCPESGMCGKEGTSLRRPV
jgi:lysyl oxidase